MSQRVRLQVPEDLSTDDVIKSLEATIETLRKGGPDPDLSVLLSGENPAASHLVKFVDDSFDIMMNSLAKEISKVLSSK